MGIEVHFGTWMTEKRVFDEIGVYFGTWGTMEVGDFTSSNHEQTVQLYRGQMAPLPAGTTSNVMS
jgi:hypothetical protein